MARTGAQAGLCWLADRRLSAKRWASPIIHPGQHLQARPLQGFSPEQLGELSRLGGQIISQNAHGLNVREQIEAMRREQAARQNLGRHPQGQQPQSQTQGRNPQGQQPQQQAQGQHAQEQTPQGQAGPGQAQSSWGQLANAEAQRWNALIDRLDEAAIADGGGPITIAAAAARAPARAFLTLLRDAVGTASLGDPVVRAQLLDQLGHLVKNPGVVLDAVTHYWNTHSAGEIAGDAFANGAAGLMGAGMAGRMVNGVRGAGRVVGENAFTGPPPGGRGAQFGAVGDLGGAGGVNISIPSRVQSRINLENIQMEHVRNRHFNPRVNASQFTITEQELRIILQNRQTVSTPVSRVIPSGNGVVYVREIDMGRSIGRDKFSGYQPTSVITIMTDAWGNLQSTFPGRLPR